MTVAKAFDPKQDISYSLSFYSDQMSLQRKNTFFSQKKQKQKQNHFKVDFYKMLC